MSDRQETEMSGERTLDALDVAGTLKRLARELGTLADGTAAALAAAGYGEIPLRRRAAPVPDDDRLAAVAGRLIAARIERERHFPGDLFGEPAWDMLLDLFVARIEGRMAYISSACVAARTPPTTALRYIRYLERSGQVIRTPDGNDGRRFNLTLSDQAYRAMQAALAAFAAEGL